MYTQSILSKTKVPFEFAKTDTCFSKQDGLWCKVAGCRIADVERFLEAHQRDKLDFDIDAAVGAFVSLVSLPQLASQLTGNERTSNLRSSTLTTVKHEGVLKYIYIQVMI